MGAPAPGFGALPPIRLVGFPDLLLGEPGEIAGEESNAATGGAWLKVLHGAEAGDVETCAGWAGGALHKRRGEPRAAVRFVGVGCQGNGALARVVADVAECERSAIGGGHSVRAAVAVPAGQEPPSETPRPQSAAQGPEKAVTKSDHAWAPSDGSGRAPNFSAKTPRRCARSTKTRARQPAPPAEASRART